MTIHEGMAKQILALLLRDSSILEEYTSDIPKDVIEHPVLAPVLRAILQFFEETKQVPGPDYLLQSWLEYCQKNPSAIALLKPGNDLIKEITEITPAVGAKELLIKSIRTKKIGDIGRALFTLDEDATAEEVSRLRDKFDQVVGTYGLTDVSDDLGYFYFYEDRNDLYKDNTSKIVPLGIPSIDAALDGGIGPGEMFVIGGGRGKGKSIVLANIAATAARLRRKVLIVTLEVSKRRYTERLDSILLNISSAEVRNFMVGPGRLTSGLDELRMKALGYAIGTKIKPEDERIVILERPAKHFGCTGIIQHVRKLERMFSWRPDIILCDYLRLFKSTIPRDQKYVELTEISEEMFGMAKILECAVGTAEQLTRGGQKKSIPTQEDMAGAIDILDAPDVGIFWGHTPEDYKMSRGYLSIVKNRKGPSDVIACMDMNKSTLRLTEGKWKIGEGKEGIKGWDKKE